MKIIDTREILTKTMMNIEAYDFKKEIKIHDKLVSIPPLTHLETLAYC